MTHHLTNIFNTYGIVQYTLHIMILTCFIVLIHEIVMSFCNYLMQKAWLKIDYEKIIYKLFHDEDLDSDECKISSEAYFNYEKKLNKKLKKKKKLKSKK